MDIKDIDTEAVLAAVIFSQDLRFYAAILVVWIMDFECYTCYGGKARPGPSSRARRRLQPDWVFRNGLYAVGDWNAQQFCEAIQKYELSMTDLKAVVEGNLMPPSSRLHVLIDFDRRLFVDGTFSDDLCRFVPPGWECVGDYPTAYLPEDIDIWPRPPKSPQRADHDEQDAEAEAAIAEVVAALSGNSRTERTAEEGKF